MSRYAGAAALAVAAALALTGCGTTVPLAQQRTTLSGGLSHGLSAQPSQDGSPLGGEQAQQGGNALPAGGSGSLAGTPGGSAGVPATAGPGAARPAVPGRSGVPVASGPVEVGVFVNKDLGPATKALGVDGLATGNGANQARASIGLLNSRGGLAGHRIVPVVFEYDATGDQNTQFQSACSLFFDDHHVRAVVSVLLLPVVQACTAKAGVPFLTSGNRTTSDAEWRRRPLTATGSQLSLERLVPTFVGSLTGSSWFAAGSRVGLLYNEDPDYAGVPGLVRKALQAHGLSLTDSQAMPGTDDTSRVSAASSAGQSAALRFASERIDRVLVIDKSGQALSYFALAAGNQSYYPAYGLTSLSLPNLLRTVLSARQLQGARGIGWSPGVDLAPASQRAVSPLCTACLDAMRKAGEDMTSAGTRLSALAICDGVMLLGAAWTDRALQPATFRSGLAALGRSRPPVMTFALDFSRRVDGVAAYRPFAFDSKADGFAYTGSQKDAP